MEEVKADEGEDIQVSFFSNILLYLFMLVIVQRAFQALRNLVLFIKNVEEFDTSEEFKEFEVSGILMTSLHVAQVCCTRYTKCI